jgi:ketosteroid isomerase-like protein
MSNADVAEIRATIENWASAVSKGDRKGILARHSQEVLMFDFPNTAKGIEAYDKTWDFFFDGQRGPITFAPSELVVTAGDDVAFATCMVHCDGTSAGPLDFRLTTGLRKLNGVWTILHEHHSMPTVEERFIPSDFRKE